jgi:hypothetical protein
VLTISFKELVGCFASGDKKKNNKPEVDQYPLPVQYIHLSFIYSTTLEN